MKLPERIVQRVNSVLDLSGKAHFTDIIDRPAETSCVWWEFLSANMDKQLTEVRNALVGEQAIAYKQIVSWLNAYTTQAVGIVVCPTIDQYDILRFEYGPESGSEYVIAELKKYDDEYGVDIVGAGFSVVEFVLRRIPEDQEARQLSDRIMGFAPDIFRNTGDAHIDFKGFNGRVVLWWD